MSAPNRIRAPRRYGCDRGGLRRGGGSHRAAVLFLAACLAPGVIGPAHGQSVRDGDADTARPDQGSGQEGFNAGPTGGQDAAQATQPLAKEALNVVHEQAMQHRRQGRLHEAAELFQRELTAVEGDPPAGPAQRAAVNHNIGEVFLRLCRYDDADARLTKAASLWNETADDSAAAATLFQLGHLRRLQGRYGEASETLRRATELCQDACQVGREGAISLSLWGDLYLAQGRLAEAEAAYAQARERASQGADEDVQTDIWSGLAMVYRRQARYREAEYAARRSIALARQGSGEQHVRVAVGLANLGLIQAFQQKYSAARKSLEDALARIERNSGSESVEAAAILSNLALVNQQTGRVAAAESLLRRAVAINTKAHGGEHPSVATGLASLGVLALQRGEPWPAADFLRKALLLTEKSAGEDHPETARVLVHLAMALTAGGRAEHALGLFERAVAIRKRTLGEKHPDVAVALAHWASALRAAGHKADAARLEKRAREMHSEQARNGFAGQTVDIETLLQDSAAKP